MSKLRWVHVGDEPSRVRAPSITVDVQSGDQTFSEKIRPKNLGRGARNGFRVAPAVVRRVGFLVVFAPAICLCLSAANPQEKITGARWAAPALQAQKKNPVSVNESSLSAGQKIYLKRCAACHGKTGNGDGPDAVDLGIHPAKFSDPKLREESDGALYWKITMGKKPMPDYGRRLSPDDRWNVINFLRTLAQR